MDLPSLLYVLSEGIRQLVSGFLAGVQNAIVTMTAAAAGSRTLFAVVEIIYGY
jgi:hypothetical protein